MLQQWKKLSKRLLTLVLATFVIFSMSGINTVSAQAAQDIPSDNLTEDVNAVQSENDSDYGEATKFTESSVEEETIVSDEIVENHDTIVASSDEATVESSEDESGSNEEVSELDDSIVSGGDVIDAGGEYTIADDATGLITISTTEPVVLVGKGIETAFKDLSVKSTEAGTNLTIRNLYIDKTPATEPMFDFTGEGNQFFFDGTSILDLGTSGSSKGYAVLHVGLETELTISGTDADDNLYIYKRDQAAGIGGNAVNNDGEPNGVITFKQGNLFIKGSQQGAVIGSGAGSGTKTAGEINIDGGTINLICVARGAGIGGSAGSGGAAAGTTVNMNAGLLNINVDWTGAAIGGGGYDVGNDSDGGVIVYKGGSVRAFIDQNSIAKWSVEAPGVNGNKAITASVVNADNQELALLELDTSLLKKSASSYLVTEDGTTIYNGLLHQYAYVNEDSSKDDGGQQTITNTPSNWTATLEEPNLYLYATKENHTYSVNGETVNAVWNEETNTFDVSVVDPADLYDWESTTWQGGLDFSWYDENDVKSEYHITTPAQWEALSWICSEDLAKLADYKTNTNGNVVAIKGTVPTAQNNFENVKFYLDNDIDMGGVEAEDGTWSGPNYYPIGSQAQNDTKNGQFYGVFYGSFDGQGHYVNNIYCERGTDQNSQSAGLFGRVGAPDDQTPYPKNNIMIENVGVSGFIKSGRSVGGIVGKTLHVANGYTVTIKNCVNRATVRSTQKKGVGGICGAFWNSPVMENCYSLGTAGGGTPAGSIVGGNEGTITNVYSTQNLAVAGEKATQTASVTNGYALGIDKLNEEAEAALTEADMQTEAFAEVLGDGFVFVRNSYPMLVWEVERTADEEAAAVDELIDQIGEVTLDSGDAIAAAREAYDALSDEAKAKVTKLDTLTEAEEVFAKLNYSGLCETEDGWVYLTKGKIDTTVTGLFKDATTNKWYLIHNGKHDQSFVGVAKNPNNGNWYFVENGTYVNSFTGVAKSIANGKWYFVQNGQLNWKFTGFGKSVADGKWYFVKNGELDWTFTGFGKSATDGKWYFAKNGKLDWTFTGFGKSVANGKWYFAKNGALDWTFTGFGKSVANGKWYFARKGELDWNFTGVAKSVANGKWYFARKGELDWNYTGGAVSVANGKWYYVKKGELDWTYTGKAKGTDGVTRNYVKGAAQ